MLTVIEGLLNRDEAARFRERLQAAPWTDGAASAGPLARQQKRNLQLDAASPAALELSAEVLRRVESHPQFIAAALPRKIFPPRFNRYEDGGAYGPHVDSAILRGAQGELSLRSDVSATLFLSEPDDYDGGELEIETAFGLQRAKLAAGDLVLYPSSSLHQVAPVTRGVRLAGFFWVESLVGDEGERALLFDLDQSIQTLAARLGTGDAQLLSLSHVYHNLLRRWGRT
jgi:PKHD-type hydroxylase